MKIFCIIKNLIDDFNCLAENTDDFDDFDKGYLSGICECIDRLESVLGKEQVNKPFDAKEARRIACSRSEDLVIETLEQILSDIRSRALKSNRTANFLVDEAISDKIDYELELLGFDTSLESTTSEKDLITVEW